MKTFRGELQRWRHDIRGWSLTRLGSATGYSRTHLANVEAGRRSPSAALVKECDSALQANGELVALARNASTSQHPSPAVGRRLALGVRPAQLPPNPAGFTGREVELERLATIRAEGVSVLAISGTAGVGKTALALRYAREIQGDFPDGQLHVDLQGHSDGSPADPSHVLDQFCRALSVAPDDIPPHLEGRAARFRAAVRGRKILVVLDNASSVEQLRPLLPNSTGCLAVVTSRHQISDLMAWHGGHRITVQPLDASESLAMLRRTIDRADDDPPALLRLADRCGHLPLALRVAAERVNVRSHTPLGELADELAEMRGRLGQLVVYEDAASTAVHTVLSWSYQALPAEAARMFRMLGLHPGPEMCLGATAALANVTRIRARELLDVLVAGNLATEVRNERFKLHDLLFLYARDEVHAEESEQQRLSGLRRMVEWYLHKTEAANRVLAPSWREPLDDGLTVAESDPIPDRQRGLEWYDVNVDGIIAITRLAHKHGFDDLAWRIPVAAFEFFHLRKLWIPWIEAYSVGLASAIRIGNLWAEAVVRHGLGAAAIDQHKWDEGLQQLELAVELWDKAGDQSGQAWTSYMLGVTHHLLGDDVEAMRQQQAAYNHHHAVGAVRGQILSLAARGDIHRSLGQLEAALADYGRASKLAHTHGDPAVEGHVITKHAAALRESGDDHGAQSRFEVSLAIHRAAGHRQGEALTLADIAGLLHDTGRSEEAEQHWTESIRILSDLNDPQVGEVRSQREQAVTRRSARLV